MAPPFRSLAEVLGEGRPELIDLLAAKDFGEGDAILALNAAMMQDGVVIEIAPGARLPEPIEIVYASATPAPAARFYRSLVVVGAGAEVALCESSLGRGGRSGQTYGCLVVQVGDKAEVRHTSSITRTEPGSLRIDSFVADLGAAAKFDSFALVDGEGLTRRQLFMRFSGDDSHARLRGVALLQGREHADTTLDVVHKGLGCEGARGVPAHPRWQRHRRLPRPHPRAETGAEDRRQDDEPGAAALGRRVDAQQAPSSRSSPTTSSAATARPSAASTRINCSTCAPAAFPTRRRRRCYWKPSPARWPTMSATSGSRPSSAPKSRIGSQGGLNHLSDAAGVPFSRNEKMVRRNRPGMERSLFPFGCLPRHEP